MAFASTSALSAPYVPAPRFPDSSTAQRRIFSAIAAPTYTPQLAVLPSTAYDPVHLSDDPEELRCLECLGDARISYYVAKLQAELHPERPTKDLASIHSDLLTNATFQGVAHKIGFDDEPAEEYSKGPGDAFEVFIEILGKERPRAATHWVADIMSPVITAVMEEDTHKRPTKRAKTSHPQIAPAPARKPGSKTASKKDRSKRKAGLRQHSAPQSAAAAPTDYPFTFTCPAPL
ncbi:hypothetical protein DFH06DRAFT_1365947 [Mycena polygramma]|nr:hypothetical protein DFH06DRAFT_1365947 [Mycena polygramma]